MTRPEHHVMWILYFLLGRWYNDWFHSNIRRSIVWATSHHDFQLLNIPVCFCNTCSGPTIIYKEYRIRRKQGKRKMVQTKTAGPRPDSKYSPSRPSKQSEDPPNLTWEHAWRRTDDGLCMKISNLCRLQWMPQGSSTTTATISAGKTSGSLKKKLAARKTRPAEMEVSP